jgi:hypothetical protein
MSSWTDEFFVAILSLQNRSRSRFVAEALGGLAGRSFMTVAAGNFSEPHAAFPGLLAESLPHMLAVASVASDGGPLSAFSNWGPEVGVAAVGEGFTLTNHVVTGMPSRGTSFTSPQAAGLGMLLYRAGKRLGLKASPSLITSAIVAGGKANPNLLGLLPYAVQASGSGALGILERLSVMRISAKIDTTNEILTVDMSESPRLLLGPRPSTLSAVLVSSDGGITDLALEMEGYYSLEFRLEGETKPGAYRLRLLVQGVALPDMPELALSGPLHPLPIHPPIHRMSGGWLGSIGFPFHAR